MKGTLDLDVADGGLIAELTVRRISIWRTTSTFSTPSELTAATAALGETPLVRRKTGRVVVTLGSPYSQLRHLPDLPPVRPAVLEAMVATQANRFFRRGGSPLVTAAAWDKPARTWRCWRKRPRSAVAAAADEELVLALMAGLRGARLPLPCILPRPAERRLDLIPKRERALWRRERSRWNRRLAVLAVLCWIGAGAAYVGRLSRDRRFLVSETTRLANATAVVSSARRSLADAQAMIDSVGEAALHRGSVAAQLGRLLQAVPDSAYLTSVDLDDRGAGVATGSARQAADIPAALERTAVVVSPRFEGVPIRDDAAGRRWERFTLRFGRPVKQ